jgi:hypothetical protein
MTTLGNHVPKSFKTNPMNNPTFGYVFFYFYFFEILGFKKNKRNEGWVLILPPLCNSKAL